MPDDLVGSSGFDMHVDLLSVYSMAALAGALIYCQVKLDSKGKKEVSPWRWAMHRSCTRKNGIGNSRVLCRTESFPDRWPFVRIATRSSAAFELRRLKTKK